MVTLSGGNVSTGSVNLFGAPLSPQFIQNGGVLAVANQINVGTDSFYRFNAGSMSCASLSIGAAETGMGEIGRFLLGPGADKVVRTRSINFFPNGKMDVNQGAMVVDYDTGSPSPLGGIRDYIVAGFNGGSWNGNGGIGSSFAAGNPGFGVGYAEASALGSIPAIFGTVDGDAILVRTTRLGDADLSGAVNLDDFNRLAASFGTPSGAVWSQGDFNYNGAIDLGDFNLLAGNFGLAASPGGPTPQDWATLSVVIPEPGATVPLCVLCALCGVFLRKEK
jgi:hypothetical protein